MKTDNSQPTPNDRPQGRSRWPWILAAGCVLVVLVAWLQSVLKENQPAHSISKDALHRDANVTYSSSERPHLPPRFSNSKPAQTAEEIVASKVVQFARNRRAVIHALAKHLKVEVPAEMERFFDRAEAGGWDELHAAFKSLQNSRQTNNSSMGLAVLWPVVIETYGVAEAAHNWPSQKLLDYGNAVLGALRPGMIYAGGNDSGLYIPTLLNETADGERHIVVTQNALADGSYLDYLSFLYGDKMATLTKNDSQQAFNSYLEDARKRLEHDQQFSNEPKQVRPGEDLSFTKNDDGSQRFQVSGHLAVMAINEKLFQMLMDKNPDASFAMAQSFPFASTYPNATPLGPVMELRFQDEQNALTAQRAAQSVDYWRTTAQQLLSDSATPDGSDPRKAYSKLVSEQAALLLDRKYTVEAEQAFQVANEICPSSPEVVFRYVNMLIGQNRFADAVRVAENGVKAAPDNQQFRDLLNSLKTMKKN